jgi:hypothetical protein
MSAEDRKKAIVEEQKLLEERKMIGRSEGGN